MACADRRATMTVLVERLVPQMTHSSAYNYKNCQSLFGYAAEVHRRSGGKCQLCGCGGDPADFDLWRQMTVEHLIGKSQGGYLKQIRESVEVGFPSLSREARMALAEEIDTLNTVTACSFCNSTTSRDVTHVSMSQMIVAAQGNSIDLLLGLKMELDEILGRKRKDVQWKLLSEKRAYEEHVGAGHSSA
jgi:hypothetical protein